MGKYIHGLAIVFLLALLPSQRVAILKLESAGTSILAVDFKDRRLFVLDGGYRRRGIFGALEERSVLRELKPHVGDVVFVTSHDDADHIGGLLRLAEDPILRDYKSVSVVQHPKNRTRLVDRVRELGIDAETPRFAWTQGGFDTLTVCGSGVTLTVYAPVTTGKDPNSRSLISGFSLRDGAQEFSLVDLSDSTPRNVSAWAKLGKKYDGIVAPHHGSARSAKDLPSLLDRPGIPVVISANSKNRYGHPGQEFLNGVRDKGCEPLVTALGSVRVGPEGVSQFDVEECLEKLREKSERPLDVLLRESREAMKLDPFRFSKCGSRTWGRVRGR